MVARGGSTAPSRWRCPSPIASDQPVAHATSLGGLLEFSALANVGRRRLGRASVADVTVLLAVGHAEIARLADPAALRVDVCSATVPRKVGHLEGKTGRRSQRISAHVQIARQGPLDERPLQGASNPDSSHRANAEPT